MASGSNQLGTILCGTLWGAANFRSLIMKYIELVTNSGVQIIVSDQNPTQWCVFKSSLVEDRCYFTNPLNGEPVYVMVDAPHLLKNTPNKLLTKNILYENDKVACYYSSTKYHH